MTRTKDKAKETIENLKQPAYREELKESVKEKLNKGVEKTKDLFNSFVGEEEPQQPERQQPQVPVQQEVTREVQVQEVQAFERNIMQDEDQIAILKDEDELDVGRIDIGMKR